MSKKYSKIVIILISITVLSKVTGILRESFIAAAFGTSYKVDAYNIAYIIPFLLFSLIGPALTNTFIPILSDVYEKNGKKEMYNLANNVISVVLIITIIAFFIGEIFPGIFVNILAPNFNYETKKLCINLTRISIINVLFIGINYGFISILNVLDEFTSTGIMGVLLNMPIILYVIIAKKYDINKLMFFTMCGYCIQILAHIPYLIKHKYKFSFKVNFKDKRMKKMIKLIIPIIIGIGVNQVNIIIDRVMASGLQEGTISAMGYANKANEIVYTLFTGSVMVVIFPLISKNANKNDDYNIFKQSIIKVEKMTMFIIIPLTLFLAYSRRDIVTVLFKYGQFNEVALEYTSTALFYLSFSTIFYVLRDIYNKGLLALQDTKSSVINTTIGMGVNIFINLLTVKKLGLSGLCIATTISSVVTCVLLRRSLYIKANIKVNNKDIFSVIKIYINSILTIIFLYVINSIINNTSTFVNLIVNCILSAIIYFIISYITKSNELIYIINQIKNRINNFNFNLFN